MLPERLKLGAMRLIHTADIHLDTCFAGSGLPARFGNRRRQSLRDVFAAIVRRAGEWPADALLIAGDLFEHGRVSLDTIAFLRAELASIPHVTVFIAPGNHDPFTLDSPYAASVWPENAIIFSSPAWTAHALVRIPLTVHGFGFDGFDISFNPFGQLRIPSDGRMHVAVAHGSESGYVPPGKTAYAPFRAADAAPEGLSYLALGHYHAMKHLEGDYHTVVYYSGAPEGRGFGETGMHYYLEVELDGAEVRVTPVPCARVVYVTQDIDCSDFTTAQQLVHALRNIPRDPGLGCVLRVTLSGACDEALRNEFPAVYDAAAGDFEYLDLVDATVAAEDFDELARENTSLGAFVAALNAEWRDVTDPRRRHLIARARAIGVAAYRGQPLILPGAEKG